MNLRVLHVAIVCLALAAMACSSVFVEPRVADVDLLATDPLLTDPPVPPDDEDPHVSIGGRTFSIGNSWTEPTDDEVLQIVRDSVDRGAVFDSVVCYEDPGGFSLWGFKMSSGYLLRVNLFRLVSPGEGVVVLELIGNNGTPPVPDPDADWVQRALTPRVQITDDGFVGEDCDPELLEILGRNQDGTLATES